MKNLKHGFTVIEASISLSIGVMILSAATYLMVQAFGISRDAVVDFYLASQGRQLREKLSRGIDGHNGLRVGLWDSIDVQYQNEYAEKLYIDYLDITSDDFWPEEADKEEIFIRRKSGEIAYKSTSDNEFKYPLKEPLNVRSMTHEVVPRNDLDYTPRHLLSEFYLRSEIAGEEYVNYYVIKTTIMNDEDF